MSIANRTKIDTRGIGFLMHAFKLRLPRVRLSHAPALPLPLRLPLSAHERTNSAFTLTMALAPAVASVHRSEALVLNCGHSADKGFPLRVRRKSIDSLESTPGAGFQAPAELHDGFR